MILQIDHKIVKRGNMFDVLVIVQELETVLYSCYNLNTAVKFLKNVKRLKTNAVGEC